MAVDMLASCSELHQALSLRSLEQSLRMQAKSPQDDSISVNLALKAVEMLASCGGLNHAPSPAAAAAAEGNLGAGISGGELPHVQASVLYVLRVGVIEQMSENGQVNTPS